MKLSLLILWHVLAWALGGFMFGAFYMAAMDKPLSTVALALGAVMSAALLEALEDEL